MPRRVRAAPGGAGEMKAMRALLFLLIGAAAGQAEASRQGCAMAAGDAAWVEQALSQWQVVAREKLLIGSSPLPTIVTFDQACAYVSRPAAKGASGWSGTRHEGTVTLPDGKQVPVAPVSFAAPAGKETPGYFVMGLPSVWRAAGVQSGMGLERLMDGVLLHELMHAYQFYFVAPRLAELTARYRLPDDINDDSLQAAFKDNAAYVKEYEAERDLLFAAAAASDDSEARRLAGEALAALRQRRARWFTGENEKWAPLDEIFLTMEGLGQWAIWSWATDPRGGGLGRETALKEVRRGGRWWSQDEGLALFLVVDRLVPGWQKLAFADRPETAEALLARAAHPGGEATLSPR